MNNLKLLAKIDELEGLQFTVKSCSDAIIWSGKMCKSNI